MKKNDLAVAWRIYPGVSKKPIIFSDNKFKMVTACLRSFQESASGLNVKHYFILDGCPDEYEHLVKEIFQEAAITVLRTDRIGNLATFAMQVDLLSKETEADFVYFAEDDYLYQPGEMHKMVALMKENSTVDFVSGYLHRDIFIHPIHQHKREVKYAADKLWISANSTCLTFMTRVETLVATKKVLLTYSKGNNDCAMWLVLTKTHIMNPIAYWRFRGNREVLGIFKRAITYSFRYFFNPKRYTLWVPYPSITTHLEQGLTSPGTDWLALASDIEIKYIN